MNIMENLKMINFQEKDSINLDNQTIFILDNGKKECLYVI